MEMTPSFSPSMGSEKSENASLISASSCAVMSCSLASLDCLAALAGAPDSAAPPDFRFGGCLVAVSDRLLGTCETGSRGRYPGTHHCGLREARRRVSMSRGR